jgi:threonine/homoserine/homoserine lactone efflux protein
MSISFILPSDHHILAALAALPFLTLALVWILGSTAIAVSESRRRLALRDTSRRHTRRARLFPRPLKPSRRM